VITIASLAPSFIYTFQTIFALSAAPKFDPAHAWHAPLWIWVHLLQWTLANQIQDPEEDRKNKPSRPIPAGRISVDSAADIRWVMIPVCLMLSLWYGTQALLASTVFAVFTIWYNELHGDKMGLSKNVLTAIVYGCAEVGGTVAAGKSIQLQTLYHFADQAYRFLELRHGQGRCFGSRT
jgi:4-hydroxybenzoate polyprenyltransferase